MVQRKKTKDVDLKYLYYCLTNQPFLDMLQRRAENRIGSFPQITFDLLSEYAFYIPLLEEQKRISNVISFIDRKIELNKRINDNLRASRTQSQTQFELCQGAAVNADISPNLLTLDRSLRGARVRLAA